MGSKSIEILCSECGADTLLRREPVYEGFKKTGERLLCTACGYEFESEEVVPYKEKKRVEVFTEGDKPDKLDIFSEDTDMRNCRHCRHYVVNPFIQRCGLQHREVEATDLCDSFDRKEEENAEGGDPASPSGDEGRPES